MSEFIELTPELLAGFLDEAPTYLTSLEEGLLAFEAAAQEGFVALRDATDHERMNEVFRAAHSLKGISASLGFQQIRDLTHVMESLFDQMRQGARQLHATDVQTLFSAVDSLRALVEVIADPDSGPVDVSTAQYALEGILGGDGAVTAPPSTATSRGAPEMAEVDAQLIELFLEATTESLDSLNQFLLTLENKPDDADAINEVFRCAHNIKGASGAVQCGPINRLTHQMETVLDRVRNHEVQIDAALTTALLAGADQIRADLEFVRAGAWAKIGSQHEDGLYDPWLSADAPAATRPDGAGPADCSNAEHDLAGAMKIEVRFAKNFAEAPILACIIHNRLADLGRMVACDPPVESLGNESNIEVVRYMLATQTKAATIERIIRAYAVEDVKVCDPAGPTASAGLASAAPATRAAAPDASSCAKGAGPAKSDGAAGAGGGEKVGKTLRVDLERLDQLMNLGGELVITKARFVEVSRKLGGIFTQNNLGYAVDDVAARLGRLREEIEAARSSPDPRRALGELSERTLHLCDDFNPLAAIVRRVHDARTTMNEFGEAVHSLNRIAEGMQKRIMQTRMVAIGPLFQRFRRVIRDISTQTGKRVDLVLRGEATELDKRMIDELVDPLTHMVRNSADHGIESPEQRRAAGKPEAGQVTLDAFHRGRHICIEVRDDGKGLDVARIRAKIVERELATQAQVDQMSDHEAMQYVFKPGFSTAPVVTDLSGRGMGMDIVRTKIEELNGTVDLQSTPGVGTTFTIQLPLTLAIINAMMARVGATAYALPLETVLEIITVPRSSVQYVQNQAVITVRERVIPLALLEDVLSMRYAEQSTRTRDEQQLTVLILGMQSERLGLLVDELIGQDDIVIKDIAANYRNVEGIAGASIMGDGTVSLILDVGAVLANFARRGVARGQAFRETRAPALTEASA